MTGSKRTNLTRRAAAEPSLGSLDQPEDQTRWGLSSRSDREEQCEDEGSSMADEEYGPRVAAEIPEWELEEMIRDVIEQTMRRDIADRALLWLDQRMQADNRLHGTLQ
jgi:hypothetical protein